MERLLSICIAALAAAVVLVALFLHQRSADARRGSQTVTVDRPTNIDFEPVAVDETNVTQLTDLSGVREVQLTNDFDVDVCVIHDNDTDCTDGSITCTGGSNHTVVLSGTSKVYPIPAGWSLCATAESSPTGEFLVEERD